MLRNGLLLAPETGADPRVVELFALFHDVRRVSEGIDHGHGARGAELAASLRGQLYELDDERFERLAYACRWHQERTFSDDATVGTCWDADRLDLQRVGIEPDPARLNTAPARAIARLPDAAAELARRAWEQG